jgi:hypothetical protein
MKLAEGCTCSCVGSAMCGTLNGFPITTVIGTRCGMGVPFTPAAMPSLMELVGDIESRNLLAFSFASQPPQPLFTTILTIDEERQKADSTGQQLHRLPWNHWRTCSKCEGGFTLHLNQNKRIYLRVLLCIHR